LEAPDAAADARDGAADGKGSAPVKGSTKMKLFALTAGLAACAIALPAAA